MGKVVAVDAGTTGVRALVVDERAQVADVAYRELTQHFPRPGWVEHSAAEIWDAVRATLAEVGARLAGAGDTVAAIGITNQRETLVAFDRSSGRPLHRAIVWQDRRPRPSADGSSTPATSPSSGPPPAWSSIRTSAPPRRRGCSSTATSPSPPTIPTSPSARSTPGCCGT